MKKVQGSCPNDTALELLPALMLLVLSWFAASTTFAAAADLPVFERHSIEAPNTSEAIGPNVAVDSQGRVLMVWIEPVVPEVDGEAEAANGRKQHRLMFSRLEHSDSGAGTPGWTEPVLVDQATDFWPNWADTSGVVALSAGSKGQSPNAKEPDTLYVHRLQIMGEGTYDYGILMFRSVDGGQTFERLGRLNDDDVPAEHGFVSYAVTDHGVRAFWLDGRAMPAGGSQSLRTALLPAPGGEVPPAANGAVAISQELDSRVCECCPTAAASTPQGSLVLFRNRSDDEVRDIQLVRQQSVDGSGSTVPFTGSRSLHHDGWQINGCPVNGPSVAAAEGRVWAAWFTGAPVRRVAVSLSHDAGKNFGQPFVVDDQRPFGRVQLVVDDAANAWLTWLGGPGRVEEGNVQEEGDSADSDSGTRVPLLLAHVTPGGVSSSFVLAHLPPGRRTGIARLAWADGGLVAVWLENGKLKSEWLVPRDAGSTLAKLSLPLDSEEDQDHRHER